MEEQTGNPVRIHVTEPEGNGWLIELFAINEPVDIPTPKVPPAPPPGRNAEWRAPIGIRG